MKNNDKNKNNLSPEELEKISGGIYYRPTIGGAISYNRYGRFIGQVRKAKTQKKMLEEILKQSEEKNKKDAETTLLPKEPEKNN